MCVCVWQKSVTDKGHAFIPGQTFTEGPSGFSPAPIDSYCTNSHLLVMQWTAVVRDLH